MPLRWRTAGNRISQEVDAVPSMRRLYQTGPDRYEYALTRKGTDIILVNSGAGPGRRQMENCRRGWSAAEIYQQAQRPPGQGRTSRRKVRRGAPKGQPAAGPSWCGRSRPLAVDQIRHVAAPLAATFTYGT